MGREGVAYTFVTTEEGSELTRIEILINRLLKRDEIKDFAAVATVVPAGSPLVGATAATAGDAEPAAPKPPRPTPPGRRPPKRHRRAL
jgi:ATP-dependent RNA helicase DeaD